MENKKIEPDNHTSALCQAIIERLKRATHEELRIVFLFVRRIVP